MFCEQNLIESQHGGLRSHVSRSVAVYRRLLQLAPILLISNAAANGVIRLFNITRAPSLVIVTCCCNVIIKCYTSTEIGPLWRDKSRTARTTTRNALGCAILRASIESHNTASRECSVHNVQQGLNMIHDVYGFYCSVMVLCMRVIRRYE